MAADMVGTIAALLSRAESAHGDYEATELNGVYDEAWAEWYAAYAVQHGIGDVLGHSVTPERLGTLLASTFDDFRTAEGSPGEPWAIYVARRIAAEL